MTERKKAELKERAKAKRKRKKKPEPTGIVEQVTQFAQGAAQTVGEAVKSATAAITGTKRKKK